MGAVAEPGKWLQQAGPGARYRFQTAECDWNRITPLVFTEQLVDGGDEGCGGTDEAGVHSGQRTHSSCPNAEQQGKPART